MYKILINMTCKTLLILIRRKKTKTNLIRNERPNVARTFDRMKPFLQMN